MHTITEKLQAAAEQHVQDGDLVILYVGGHGITAGAGTVLAPIDFSPDNQFGVALGCLKDFLAVFQARNPRGVNHVAWNSCGEPLVDMNLPNLPIAGSNYHVLFACPDTRLSYIGNNHVQLDGSNVQVSNFALAYADAVRWEPNFISAVHATRTKLLRMTPPQVCPAYEALEAPQVGFGLLDVLDSVGRWLWPNVVVPGATTAAQAGWNAAAGVAAGLIRQRHDFVDNTDALHGHEGQPLQNGTYTIQVAGGTNQGKTYLSCTSNGEVVNLFHMIENTGRQKWTYKHRASFGTFKAAGGIDGDRVWLNSTSDGKKVDLVEYDDATGRQRWTIEACSDGTCNVKVFGGVTGKMKYLSCMADGKVDLYDKDDTSGRQRWIFKLAE